ncbi:MAG: ribonucleoside triphosphate reductase, partial [Chloroflexi bacterium]|nr:ribonucleoside triphosphate reductase [Chloroflexota bacterium]
FQEATYREFQPEMDLLNRTFAELMLEGDARGRVFTFPIPTYNITADFDWDNPNLDPIWQMTAKYGIPYFANFVNSDLRPEDVRSMCCRLRLSNKELIKRGGGLFGSNPLTGSIGVVTLNMARIGYLSKTENEFFERVARLMDIAKESLLIRRRVIENFTEHGLYPYSRHYLDGVK